MKEFTEKDLVRKENAPAQLSFHGGALPYFSFPSLDEAGLVNAFTTKKGGVSTGAFAELDLSFTKEPMEIIRENYRRVAERLGADPMKIVSSNQTHTTNVRLVTAEDAGKGPFRERDYQDVDGLVTNVPGLILSTLYADCVPLYFYDPEHQAIGLSHSGWKGTASRMGAATVRKMQECFGTDPAQLIAAVGPSICADCYEVSEDVAEAFRESFGEEDLNTVLRAGRAPGKYQLDLWEANRRVLMAAGIPEGHISVTDICTKCNQELLYSHRVMGPERGIQAALLGLPEGPVQAGEHQYSCGAVVFRDTTEGREYLLVRQRKGHWSFSKGHMEGAETEEETAHREILEETGLAIRFLPGFRTGYTYEKEPGVLKTVTFFLAESLEGELHFQKEELIDAGWFSSKEALQRITYERDREVFRKLTGQTG
ncbi:MAG: peptidoglycan editing factor PgeF [Lachnospiraceae bacterium]|nr:peptidoglycan editing factor PgeF [Lachnospiraceae bacterium]